MESMQVFENTVVRCNSSGCGCSGDIDQQLIDFASDVDWATKHGAQIERFNFEQQPLAFTNNQTVKNFLQRCGEEMLPLILVNGEIFLAARYPNRFEIASWVGTNKSAEEIKPLDSCCNGGRCTP